jgi:hypothetical protein
VVPQEDRERSRNRVGPVGATCEIHHFEEAKDCLGGVGDPWLASKVEQPLPFAAVVVAGFNECEIRQIQWRLGDLIHGPKLSQERFGVQHSVQVGRRGQFTDDLAFLHHLHCQGIDDDRSKLGGFGDEATGAIRRHLDQAVTVRWVPSCQALAEATVVAPGTTLDLPDEDLGWLLLG